MTNSMKRISIIYACNSTTEALEVFKTHSIYDSTKNYHVVASNNEHHIYILD